MVLCGLGSVQSLGWNFVFGVPVYGVAGTCFTLGCRSFLVYTAVQQAKCHEKSVAQGLAGSGMERSSLHPESISIKVVPGLFHTRQLLILCLMKELRSHGTGVDASAA